jgi:hypothetical protein
MEPVGLCGQVAKKAQSGPIRILNRKTTLFIAAMFLYHREGASELSENIVQDHVRALIFLL